MWKMLLPALASMLYLDGEQPPYDNELMQPSSEYQDTPAYVEELHDLPADVDMTDTQKTPLDDLGSGFFKRMSRTSFNPAYQSERQELLETALEHLQSRRGLGEEHKHSRRSLCTLVCGYCDQVATKRLAVLCAHQCQTKDLGNAYDRCLILWLDSQAHLHQSSIFSY